MSDTYTSGKERMPEPWEKMRYLKHCFDPDEISHRPGRGTFQLVWKTEIDADSIQVPDEWFDRYQDTDNEQEAGR